LIAAGEFIGYSVKLPTWLMTTVMEF